ncbi:MAG TPA: hypothetical protein VIR01_16000 [Pyrinomonadaceae bacterium]
MPQNYTSSLEIKGLCTYTFQKAVACPNTRRALGYELFKFARETMYNPALRRGANFAMPFSNRQLTDSSCGSFLGGVDQKGFGLRDSL